MRATGDTKKKNLGERGGLCQGKYQGPTSEEELQRFWVKARAKNKKMKYEETMRGDNQVRPRDEGYTGPSMGINEPTQNTGEGETRKKCQVQRSSEVLMAPLLRGAKQEKGG